ncbi:hypothetical protein [Aureivirga sp. CE67]|uniref:hypothetical protein n=1 Tax=Aureivirga sp. CE67 TaxID=1788983 RepID=UPI0018CB1DB7|nr:hypothetical protein [Aureivirga sp. CE67]
MSSIIEAMINAKKYYDEGISCTVRIHNYTSERLMTEKIGPSKDFSAATSPPLFIEKDKYGDGIFNASKVFKGILNLFYSIKINSKTYAIHINYEWKKMNEGEIEIKVVEGDNLYPNKEKWIPLFCSGNLSSEELPFIIRYMASGSFVEIGIFEK